MLWKAVFLLALAATASVPEATMSPAGTQESTLEPAEETETGAPPPPHCEAGQYLSKSGTCTSCPIGTYSATANSASSCTACPHGTSTELPGSTQESDCESCPLGTYYRTASRSCVSCPIGWFGGGEHECAPCKTGITKGEKSQSEMDCVECPEGYYRTPTSSPSHPEELRCIKCPSGQTVNAEGNGCRPLVKSASGGGSGSPLVAAPVDAGAGAGGAIGAIAGSAIGASNDPLKPKPNIIGMIVGGTAAILAVGCLIWHKKSTEDDEPWWEREYPFLKDDAPRHVRRALRHQPPPSTVF